MDGSDVEVVSDPLYVLPKLPTRSDSRARHILVPITFKVTPPPTQTIAAAMCRSFRNSHSVMRSPSLPWFREKIRHVDPGNQGCNLSADLFGG
jgi:hypothetical protein